MNLQMQSEGATCVCSHSFQSHLLTSKTIHFPSLTKYLNSAGEPPGGLP